MARRKPGTDQGNLFQDLSVIEEKIIPQMDDAIQQKPRDFREIEPLVYNGERVLTFEDIDEIHGRPPGSAKRIFHRHRHEIYEDHDYFSVSGKEFEKVQRVKLTLSHSGGRDRILLTKWGYHIIIRSFQDQFSKEIYRQVLAGYFISEELRTDEGKANFFRSTASAEIIRKVVKEEQASFLQSLKDWLMNAWKEVLQGNSETKQKDEERDKQLVKIECMIAESQRRREATAATEDELLRTLQLPSYNGMCACCGNVRILDQNGNKLPNCHLDHWYDPWRNAPWEMWPTCAKCNLDLRDADFKDKHHPCFRTFQLRREDMLESFRLRLPFDK